jgi:hypothetical protein
MQRTRTIGCAVIIGCLIVTLSCGFSVMAIQLRLVAGPDVQVQLGAYHLAAYTTKRSKCPPYGGRKPSVTQICSTDSILPGGDVYVIWLVRSVQPGDRRELPHRLFALPMY